MKTEAALGYKIGKITDVNGDGVNEILSFNGYSNHGETSRGATLGQITGGKYQEIKSFAGYSDGCATASEEREIAKASVISYVLTTNGKMPIFTEEYFQKKCEETTWKKITKAEFEKQRSFLNKELRNLTGNLTHTIRKEAETQSFFEKF